MKNWIILISMIIAYIFYAYNTEPKTEVKDSKVSLQQMQVKESLEIDPCLETTCAMDQVCKMGKCTLIPGRECGTGAPCPDGFFCDNSAMCKADY